MKGEEGTLCGCQYTQDLQYVFLKWLDNVLIPCGPSSLSFPMISPPHLEVLIVVLELSEVPYL